MAGELKKQSKQNADEKKHLSEKIKALESELQKKQKEFTDLKETLQRVQADYENAMKRKEKEIAIAQNKALASVLSAFLPVLDSVEEALKHSKDKGLLELKSQLVKTFNQFGVFEIKSSEKFNPHEMECVMRASDPGKEDGMVLEEFQKGYMFNDSILRPAKVKVNFVEKKETKKAKNAFNAHKIEKKEEKRQEK